MPESTKEASMLINISYRALKRVEADNQDAQIADRVVMMIFAAFFIEANLNHIIKALGKEKDVETKWGANSGLGNKLAWFYNAYVSSSEITSKKEIYQKTCERFPCSREICDFRDCIAHGELNKALPYLSQAEEMRAKAKDIVDELFKILKVHGHEFPRVITYNEANEDFQQFLEISSP